MVRRTKKEFKDYNEYRDRPFSLKWGTAFAMDDLMKGVRENHRQAMKDNKLTDQMARVDIDSTLAMSFLQNKEIEIQLNLKDKYGRPVDLLVGKFSGEAYEDYIVFNNHKVFWGDIRSVVLKDFRKWSNVEVFDESSPKVDDSNEDTEGEIELIKDEFYQAFPDELEDS